MSSLPSYHQQWRKTWKLIECKFREVVYTPKIDIGKEKQWVTHWEGVPPLPYPLPLSPCQLSRMSTCQKRARSLLPERRKTPSRKIKSSCPIVLCSPSSLTVEGSWIAAPPRWMSKIMQSYNSENILASLTGRKSQVFTNNLKLCKTNILHWMIFSHDMPTPKVVEILKTVQVKALIYVIWEAEIQWIPQLSKVTE